MSQGSTGGLQREASRNEDRGAWKVGQRERMWRRSKKDDQLKCIPFRFQGLNTGVVLYRLERMRRSVLYSSYLHPEALADLMDRFSNFASQHQLIGTKGTTWRCL